MKQDLTKDNSSSDPNSAKPTAIVGIGASAGGLEAIETFFKNMPVDSGMAFVVIQHLSPDYKSLMVELLSRKTEMPVLRVEDGMEVEANHIYLIPPKKSMTIFHGKLLLKEQEPRDGINLPVDIFLRSLAEDQGEKTVAIILSGTGSDGTRGVRAIKEGGGLVLVQDGSSARFDGMPRAAASTGVADYILTPEEMPAELIACLQHPFTTRENHQQALSSETGLTRLFSLLRTRTGVDFTYYKPSTISRRIDRRIAVTQVDSLDAYVRYAEETPAEISSLYRELLIGVTSFFRDPKILENLEMNAMPELLQRHPNRELRFWTAGCSTGEEAYTLAIIAREVTARLGITRDIKIFATDIDRDAIARAGSGLYPESIAADLRPELLSRYFYSRGDSFQVARNIREMVVFAQHNLVKDPPFPRIDLVSCRNLLIYLQSNLQQRALEMFSFSLQPGGILLLGSSETVGDMEDTFEPIDRKARIYRATGKGRYHAGLSDLRKQSRTIAAVPGAANGIVQQSRHSVRQQDRLMTRLLDSLAESYAPLTVVVNEQLEVLYSIGDPGGFFRLPSGRAVYDISRMVDRELAIPLATGIQKVFRSGEELVYSNVRLRDRENVSSMRLRIRPLPGRNHEPSMVVVFFEEIRETSPESGETGREYHLDEETDQRMQDLEQELQFTRENLQATIEELETSNEELQATNEELLSSNEELQSTNEELQSTNEELYTVNAEYQNKIIELTEVRNDVDNLLSSSRIGTLILDENLAIRRYSPQAAEVFNLVESDIGRPLNHLSHKLQDFEPVAAALEVQKTNTTHEEEAVARDGTWYLVRVLPYYVGPKTISGVVFTLIDVSTLRETRARLESFRKTTDDISRHMPSGLLVYNVTDDDELILQSGNDSAHEITGIQVEASVGKSFTDLWPGERSETLRDRLLETYHNDLALCEPEFSYSDDRTDGIYHIHAFRLPGERLAVSFENIAGQKRAEQALAENERRFRSLYHLLADAETTARMGSWTWDVATDTVTWSDNLFRLFGRDPEDGAPSFTDHDVLYTPSSMKKLRKAVEKTLNDGVSYEVELEAVRGDGSIMRCIARGEAERNGDGTVQRLYGSLQEIGI